jgi:hypothetical protein
MCKIANLNREVKRNIGKTGYRAFTASQRAKVAASSSKKERPGHLNRKHCGNRYWGS